MEVFFAVLSVVFFDEVFENALSVVLFAVVFFEEVLEVVLPALSLTEPFFEAVQKGRMIYLLCRYKRCK